MVLAFCFTNFVFKIFYIPSLLCDGIFMLCLNGSLFFLKPIVVSQKEKKRGGGMGGWGAHVRYLRLKNWLPLESTNIYKVVRS